LKVEKIFPIPNSICIYHANWIVKTQNISWIQHKEFLLAKVKETLDNNRNITTMQYFISAPFHICMYYVFVIQKICHILHKRMKSILFN
jgi:hypothetical protein